VGQEDYCCSCANIMAHVKQAKGSRLQNIFSIFDDTHTCISGLPTILGMFLSVGIIPVGLIQ